MSTHRDKPRSSAPSYPDAEPVGPHLVIDKTEWVPGAHPDRDRRYAGQPGYSESYYRCVKCGVECLATDDFPPECDAEVTPGG